MRYFFAILNPHYASYKPYCIKIKNIASRTYAQNKILNLKKILLIF